MAQCAAITRSGERCKARAIDGSDHCYNHSELHAQERRRNASKGGLKAGRGRPLVEVRDLKAKLYGLADDARSGEVSTAVAAVTNQIYNTLVRLIDLEVRVKEQEEVLVRIEKLEQGGDHAS